MLALRGVINSGLLKAFGGNSIPLTSNVQPAAIFSVIAKRSQSSVPQSGTAETNGTGLFLLVPTIYYSNDY